MPAQETIETGGDASITGASSGSAPALGNIRPDPAPFFGRRALLDELCARLRESGGLLTISGPPGVGKTRLAGQVAARLSLELQPRYGGGAWFCDVSPARDAKDVIARVAALLGVPLSDVPDSARAMERLGHALDGRGPILVVLDNLEQVVEAVAPMIHGWVAAAPSARLLVTSRERVRLPEERVVALDPLAVPDQRVCSLDELLRSDAGRLFVECVRRARGAFEPTGEEVAAITAIVRHLDGLPLALELAAARMRVLGPGQILERLNGGGGLLRGGYRTTAPRHQSLEAAIDWSWDLLEPWERDALVQCTVFRGPFELEAAEAVVELSSQPGALSVLDVLQSLCDQSLLRAVHDSAGPGGPTTYALYESVRDYAAARVEASTLGSGAARRHAGHVSDSAWRRADEADAFGGLETLRQQERLEPELQAVIERWGPGGRFEQTDDVPSTEARTWTVKAALGLHRILRTRQPLSATIGRLDRLVADLPGVIDPALDIELRIALGGVLRPAGRYDEAGRTLDGAIAWAHDEGRSRLEGRALIERGHLHLERGEVLDCLSCCEQADALLAGRPEWIAARGLLARAHLLLGDFDQASAHYRAALDAPATGSRRARAGLLTDFAWLQIEMGRLADAEASLDQALDLYEFRCDPSDQARALWLRAYAALSARDWTRATTANARASALVRAAGNRLGEAVSRTYDAAIALDRGDLATARRQYEAARRTFEALNNPRQLAFAHVGRAVVELEVDARDAAEHFVRAAGRTVQSTQIAQFEAGVAALEGVCAALAGHRARTLAAFDRAETAAARTNGASLRGFVDVLRGFLDLLDARQARERGHREAEEQARSEARRRLARALRPATDASKYRASVDDNFDVRRAARLLDGRLDPEDRRRAWTDARDPDGRALVVDSPHARVRPPGGRWRDLSHRPLYVRLLRRLIQARMDAPGSPVSIPDLIEAGWPGERMSDESALNRVYKSISELRSLGGLRSLIYNDGAGYLLDHQVELVRIPARL